MKDDHRLAETLQQCMALMDGGATVESCLRCYPEMAGEPEGLLRVSHVARAAGEALHPRAEFRDAVLARVRRERYEPDSRARRWWPRLLSVARPWAVALVAVVVLVSTGLGVSSATASSVPGERLYAVKSAQERFLLLLVPTDQGKARLHARLARQRAYEMERLAARGAIPTDLDRVAERMTGHARQVVVLMGGKMVILVRPEAGERPVPPIPATAADMAPGGLDGSAERAFRARLEMRLALTEEMWRQRALQPRFVHGLSPSRREHVTRAFERSQFGLYQAIMALDRLDAAE